MRSPRCPARRTTRSCIESGAFLDPDLNKYDLEHVTTEHARMTAEQWTKLYRDTWKEFYTLEHMETAAARGGHRYQAGNMVPILLWFHFCIVYEKIDPLQGGFLRRKYRRDRWPTMPIESPFRVLSAFPRRPHLQAHQAGATGVALSLVQGSGWSAIPTQPATPTSP